MTDSKKNNLVQIFDKFGSNDLVPLRYDNFTKNIKNVPSYFYYFAGLIPQTYLLGSISIKIIIL